MRNLWDSSLTHFLMKSRFFQKLWRPISPLYNRLTEQAFFRNGIVRDLGGGYKARVCFNNRRLKPSEELAREICWISETVKPGMTVLDIGANIGIFSILMSEVVGDGGRVFAFEPSPVPFRDLYKNAQLNKQRLHVNPVQMALGNQIGELDFYLTDDPNDTQHSAVKLAHLSQNKKISVPVSTVDAFCAQKQIIPNVIKIDVEGFEPFVLEGAQETIRQAHDLRIFVELHPWAWNSLGYDQSKFNNLLHKLGLVEAKEAPTFDARHIKLEKRS